MGGDTMWIWGDVHGTSIIKVEDFLRDVGNIAHVRKNKGKIVPVLN
jgi:hypothetical protein